MGSQPASRPQSLCGCGRKPGPHHFTLLDGEMVVDENLETDQRVRRYLAYDMVLDNTSSVATLPFIVRCSGPGLWNQGP